MKGEKRGVAAEGGPSDQITSYIFLTFSSYLCHIVMLVFFFFFFLKGYSKESSVPYSELPITTGLW